MIIFCILMVLNGINAFAFKKTVPFYAGVSMVISAIMFVTAIENM